jgi:hypothetical protein
MFQGNSIRLGTKIAVPAALAGLIISSGCSSKTPEMQSHWSAESIKVDGKFDDWADTPLNYFKDSQVSLGLRNDVENLYILFRFKNESWARLIQMGGVTLWLDKTGKKKKNFGLRYTGGPPPSQMRQPGEGDFSQRPAPEQQERTMEMQAQMANQFTIIDKQADEEVSIPADGSQGPAVSSAYENGFYSYELQIPLQSWEDNYYAINTQVGETIGLGLEWGGMDNLKQMMQQRGEGMESGPPGGIGPGSGRPPEGIGPGSGGPGGPPGRRSEPKKQKIWIKTLLASIPEG